MKPERIAEIRQALREAGVPEEVVAYATEDGLHWWLHTAAGSLFLTLMLVGSAVGGFYLWPALENVTAQNARAHAESAGALLYHYNFGLSLVLATLAWISAGGAIAGLAPALSSRLQKNVFVFSVLDGKRSPKAEWGVRRTLEQLRVEADPARFVRRMVDRQLGDAGAVFSSWDWLGRDPQHPLCIAALRDRYSDDNFVRVRRLLRLAD